MARTTDALTKVRARLKKGDAPDAKQLESAERALARLSARLSGLFLAIESGDAAPSAQAVAEFEDIHATLEKVIGPTLNS
jgi:hypothetical protein